MKQKLTLRRVLASAVAALAVWLLCRWVGYDLQLRIGNEPVYEIANDDYTQIIDVPEDGLWQAVPLEAGQTLYGCRLRFSTHGELYRAGMVMVDLCDADGTILREAAGNYANIFDDNFTGFAFGTAYTAAQAETLCLHIYNVVEWEGPLGLWASTGTVGALALTADGVDADATLALQYMTDDTGSWPSDLANGLAPLLAFAAFAAVLLFGLRAPLPLTVAVVGLACGLLFVRVTPALVAPDEYTHLAAAYEMASRLGGETPADENGCLLVRESDAPHFGTRSGEIGILAYKAEALARQNEAGGPDALTAVSEAKAGQGSGNYLPQALGIRLARNAGANFYTMLRQARTFNLIFYLLLAVLAVALAPAAVRGLHCAAADAAAVGGQSLARCVGAGHGVLLHGALPAAAHQKSCVVGKNPAHRPRRGCRPGQGHLPAGGTALLYHPGGQPCGADGICPGLVWCARALRAADPGGCARAGGLPVALRQPR